MAITTLAGAKAGLIQPIYFGKAQSAASAGPYRTAWAQLGTPGAGTYDTTLNGVALSGTNTGRVNYVNPASGNTYLAGFNGVASASSGFLILCDRLWHNGGFTINTATAQNITSPVWPARDVNGSTNGVGVFLALEVSATCGAATPTITVSYTNSAGTAGRTATNVQAAVSGQSAGAFYMIGLQAGDIGVRSVQSLTLSVSWVSGTINLVAYRPVGVIQCNPGLTGLPTAEDALSTGFSRIFDSSVLWPVLCSQVSGSSTIAGTLLLAQG